MTDFPLLIFLNLSNCFPSQSLIPIDVLSHSTLQLYSLLIAPSTTYSRILCPPSSSQIILAQPSSPSPNAVSSTSIQSSPTPTITTSSIQQQMFNLLLQKAFYFLFIVNRSMIIKVMAALLLVSTIL